MNPILIIQIQQARIALWREGKLKYNDPKGSQ